MECYFDGSFHESKKKWLKKDAVFTVQENESSIVIYGTDVSWRKDVYPLLGDIAQEAEGLITIVADSLTIDRDVVIDKLTIKIIVDNLIVKRGRLLIQDGAKTKNSNDKYDPALQVYANHLEGQFSMSTLGSHRESSIEAPFKLSYRTASSNVFESSLDLGLSPLHHGMCNNCILRKELNGKSTDDEALEFAEKQSRLAFWAGRRIYISNLINPSVPTQSKSDQLRILDRLVGNGYGKISPAIPDLAVIASNLQRDLDVLGGKSYGVDKNIVDIAAENLIRANTSFERNGLISDILQNLSKAKENLTLNENTKKQLEENKSIRKDLITKEMAVLKKINALENEIIIQDREIAENEITLEGFVEFDAIVARRDAKKKKQFASVASGAKLAITVVGSIYGGWGAAAAGALNVGVDVETARRLDQKLDIKETLEKGWKAYETAKEINKAFKVADKKWNAYKDNRKILRVARRQSDDVKGSWIDALKLTKKQASDKEKSALKKGLSIFKDMKVESFTFEPVASNSARTNQLLKLQTELEEGKLSLVKNKATLATEHINITTSLDALDDFSRKTTFFSSLESGYEQKMWLLSSALDYVLVDYFEKYYLLKSSLHGQNIVFDEERLDKTAWTIGFREYLNIVKKHNIDVVQEDQIKNFVQGLRVSSTVIMHELNNAISEAKAKGFKTPFEYQLNIKSLEDRFKGKDSNGKVSYIQIPDKLVTSLLTNSSRNAYIVEAELIGDAGNNWSIFALPLAYRFEGRECKLISNRSDEWIELGKSIKESEDRPFRFHQLRLLPINNNATKIPETLRLVGFIN